MGEWQHAKVRSKADRQVEAIRLAARRRNLNQRLRLAFIAGSEERSRRELGRGLTDEELRRTLRRYPGDLPER
jgi:hypothetical protein